MHSDNNENRLIFFEVSLTVKGLEYPFACWMTAIQIGRLFYNLVHQRMRHKIEIAFLINAIKPMSLIALLIWWWIQINVLFWGQVWNWNTIKPIKTIAQLVFWS